MSPRQLPVLNGRQVVRALKEAGFDLVRISESHHVLLHPGPPARMVSVPVHRRGKDPPRGTLKAVVEQSGMSVEAFIGFL